MATSSSSSTIASSDLHVDESYFSALVDSDELIPISDEKYAEALQLQEALMSSMVASATKTCAKPSENEVVYGSVGESSNTKFFCEICMEGAKIQENISTVTCPDVNCKRVLEPEVCRSFIPEKVFDRWMNALCESYILGSQKFYCPYKDCSAMLIDEGGEIVRESECPTCRRLFCALCRVPWHGNISCENFQNLNEYEKGRDDLMVMELAKQNKWSRCPSCVAFSFAITVEQLGLNIMVIAKEFSLQYKFPFLVS
ncbi:RING/U-box superfamily protein [Thalictrum thalictroides]|uniref:RBR-type E3 ubiquitin transferase n=1 Tax=Thalictrum thalictroides TaxID=46969 RepID=A0A7J6VB84_THATH|nr:RING/U-box superfamily protein [Thalictrum thalictroides]